MAVGRSISPIPPWALFPNCKHQCGILSPYLEIRVQQKLSDCKTICVALTLWLRLDFLTHLPYTWRKPITRNPGGPMHFIDYLQSEKQRTLENCTRCGQCIKKCPIIEKSALSQARPREIQGAVLDFLRNGAATQQVLDRVNSCMQCYGCLSLCPEGLNPLLTIYTCMYEMEEKGIRPNPPWDPKSPELVHRILAAIQTTPGEYDRIFTPSPEKKAATLFFPGCNVYWQPEKILNAMDIMAHIDPGFAFIPGLDFCCGACHLSKGRPQKAGDTFGELMEKIAAYAPNTLVLWCPTCFCQADTFFSPFTSFPFEIKSMAQYAAENMEKLDIKANDNRRITLHDACKIALTGLDVPGARPILRAMGAELKEMPRIGEEAACCGCNALTSDPSSGKQMLDQRIAEADATGADVLATVCHYCGQMLASHHQETGFKVINYISLLAGAMGIRRRDRFLEYMRWADAERILADAGPQIRETRFSRELIEETVKEVFCK